MRKSFKNTKSIVITYILSLFLLAVVVSCKNSNKASSKTEKNKTTSKSTTKTPSVKNSNDDKVTKVLKTAKSYIGTQYKFGGCSRNGIDCSGLVFTSFNAVNIQLPRTSGEQSKTGKVITISELEPGDLVFFTDKKGNKKITHVGIITEAKGKKNTRFIHASTKLGVVEDDLYADYYIGIFIKAARVL